MNAYISFILCIIVATCLCPTASRFGIYTIYTTSSCASSSMLSSSSGYALDTCYAADAAKATTVRMTSRVQGSARMLVISYYANAVCSGDAVNLLSYLMDTCMRAYINGVAVGAMLSLVDDAALDFALDGIISK